MRAMFNLIDDQCESPAGELFFATVADNMHGDTPAYGDEVTDALGDCCGRVLMASRHGGEWRVTAATQEAFRGLMGAFESGAYRIA